MAPTHTTYLKKPLFGAVEAGGTKFILSTGFSDGRIINQHRLETTTPTQTLEKAVAWFKAQGPLAAVGIASFGPIDLNKASPQWGYITNTPKPGWQQVNIAGLLHNALGIPVGFDTDVNAAALGEAWLGAGDDVASLVYATVGTGIGGGFVRDGLSIYGLSHAEMGHAYPPRHPEDAGFSGICPFHGACYEGLVSGPALQARFGAPLSALPDDHPAHNIAAWYLAHFVVMIQATLAPERIILGGGVMQTPQLLERIRAHTKEIARGYFPGDLTHILQAPRLKASGVIGALALAVRAWSADKSTAD
jgi:fructokinase